MLTSKTLESTSFESYLFALVTYLNDAFSSHTTNKNIGTLCKHK